jgi:hypothetical protein
LVPWFLKLVSFLLPEILKLPIMLKLV